MGILLQPQPVPHEGGNSGTAQTWKLYFVFPSRPLPINTREQSHPGAATAHWPSRPSGEVVASGQRGSKWGLGASAPGTNWQSRGHVWPEHLCARCSDREMPSHTVPSSCSGLGSVAPPSEAFLTQMPKHRASPKWTALHSPAWICVAISLSLSLWLWPLLKTRYCLHFESLFSLQL